MKQTKLQKTKRILIQIIQSCIQDRVIQLCTENITNEEFIKMLVEEASASDAAINKIYNITRMRELDTLVRHYFGEDTAEDLINAIMPENAGDNDVH